MRSVGLLGRPRTREQASERASKRAHLSPLLSSLPRELYYSSSIDEAAAAAVAAASGGVTQTHGLPLISRFIERTPPGGRLGNGTFCIFCFSPLLHLPLPSGLRVVVADSPCICVF